MSASARTCLASLLLGGLVALSGCATTARTNAQRSTPDMQALLKMTIADLVAERPARARVFETYKIDYCCGGKRSLADACASAGVDPQRVAADLQAADRAPAPNERDWRAAPLAELCGHIVATHHALLRTELPRLTQLVDKVRGVHGARHPELVECQAVFHGFRAELEMHMMKEEQILFPMITQMEAERSIEVVHCGSVANPIRQMQHEHDSAGAALDRLRSLTRDYTPPDDACSSYRALFSGLAEIESDMHRHVHKENYILFPRAVELESALAHEMPSGRG